MCPKDALEVIGCTPMVALSQLNPNKQVLAKVVIIIGQSSGAAVHQASKVTVEIDEGNIMVILADGSWKYLSIDFWDRSERA